MSAEENKSAESVTQEGQKVSGGAGQNQPQPATGQPEKSTGDTELTPQHDTKKEDMTSYNEHPDQEKVGGG